MDPITFTNCNSLFKKTLQYVDDYCGCWNSKKVVVINDKNEAIRESNSSNVFIKLAIIVSYATLIIPAIMYGLQYLLHNHYQAKALSFDSRDLNVEQKASLYPFNPMKKLWAQFRFPDEALRDHPADALFLKNSGLLFISKAHPNLPFKFDEENRPMIPCNGTYSRVDKLIEEHGFTAKNNGISYEIRDKDNKEWNFVADHGLVQTDWTFKREYPSYRLSPEELQQLKKCGKLQDNNPAKSCFVQVFTTPRPLAPDCKLAENLNDQTPSHVGVRLVLADGSVYSTGYETNCSAEENYGSFLTRFTTVPAKPSVRDYEEFARYSTRLVTTVPVTPEAMEGILNDLTAISEAPLGKARFNHLKMNCLTFASLVLKKAGVNEDFDDYFTSILYKALPDVEAIPLVGKPFARVRGESRRVVSKMPSCVQEGLQNISDFFTYIPRKIITVILNIVMLILGMGRKSKYLPKELGDGLPQDFDKLSKIERGISWNQLFDDEANKVTWPARFIAWQKKQASTQKFTSKEGNPLFNIVGGEFLNLKPSCKSEGHNFTKKLF